MRNILCAFLFLLTLGIADPSRLCAEMMPIEPGTVHTYNSANGVFQARVTIDGMGASVDLYKGDAAVWSKRLADRPGKVAVSDNGETLVLTTFGWEDERGADGFLIYKTQGNAPEVEVKFGGKGAFADLSKSGLKWVKVLAVSSDGKLIAVAEDLKENSLVTLYDAVTGEELFSQKAGFDNCVGITMAPGAEQTLLSTRNKDSDMMFVLLDKTGKMLGSKTIAKNFSYDVPVYGRFQENGFPEIFDLKSGKFYKVF